MPWDTLNIGIAKACALTFTTERLLMPLRWAAARPADFLCLAKESQQRKATPGAENSLSRVCLSAGLINSLRSNNQALVPAKLPRAFLK